MHLLAAASLVVCLAAPAAHAAPDPILGDVPLPAGYVLDADPDVVDFALETISAGAKELKMEGRRAIVAAHLEPPSDKEVDATALFTAAARKAGWRVIDEAAPYLVATRTNRGAESWLRGMCFGSGDCRFLLIEKAARQVFLKLEPPKPGAAKLPGDQEDFPYLGRWPGARLDNASGSGDIDASNEGDKEPIIVGPGVLREYSFARPTGVWEQMVAYREALEKVGWTVIKVAMPGDGVIVAHYAKNGRDVYIYLHLLESGAAYNVVDVGAAAEAAKLAAELKQKGHVALYGIYFDVDSAKLKPESDATLRQIIALLTADPSLKLEIQGHTDNTGARPHNQGLSEQRAASVVAYLTKAGIAAGRLTSAGLADTKPVADNDSTEGRAKNRRVELVRR